MWRESVHAPDTQKMKVAHLCVPARLLIACYVWDMNFVLPKDLVDNGQAAMAASGRELVRDLNLKFLYHSDYPQHLPETLATLPGPTYSGVWTSTSFTFIC